jgi:Mrp family chromosome partitioning ATPase
MIPPAGSLRARAVIGEDHPSRETVEDLREMNWVQKKVVANPGVDMKADEKLKAFTEDQALVRRLSKIKHKILVLSGKGGVGKARLPSICL